MLSHQRPRNRFVTRFGAAIGVALSLLTSACAPRAAPSGWVPIEATIAVEHLAAPTPVQAPEPLSMPLAAARTQLLFALGVPTWAPEGFELQGEVEAVLPTDSSQYAAVTLTWQNADEAVITLQASVNADAGPQLAGAGTTEQATVNSQPATLTRLGLKSAPRGLSLTWSQNGVSYTLTAEGNVLSAEELVRMAESIK